MLNQILEILFGLLCIALFLFVYIGSVAWTLRDAQKRGQSGGLIVVLFWLLGPLSALVWLIIRPNTTVIERATTIYTNSDDALAAAAQLDQLGEWDAAIAAYENAATRWPEHLDYINACIKGIQQKQAVK